MAITPSNPSGGPVLDASAFVSAGNAQLASNAAISTSILQNNPYLQKLKGYMDAQRLLNESKDIQIKEEQQKSQVNQWNIQNALESDKFKQQQVVDGQTNIFRQGMLDLQKSQLQESVNQHTIENARADRQIGVQQEQFGQTIGLQREQLGQQKDLGLAGLDIQKQGLDIQKQQLDNQTAYQNSQLDISKEQNKISQQNADSTTLKTLSDIQSTQNQKALMGEGDLTPEAFQDRLKNENEIVKKSQENAETAGSLMQKATLFKNAIDKVPYVGPGGSLVSAAAQFPAITAGINTLTGGKIPKFSEEASAAYKQFDSARAAITSLLKNAQIGNGRFNETVLGILGAQTGGIDQGKDDNYRDAAIINSTAAVMNLNPVFLGRWKSKFGNLNDAQNAYTDFGLYWTKQSQSYSGKGDMPAPTRGDLDSFIKNYPTMLQYANDNNMSVAQVLDVVNWRGK